MKGKGKAVILCFCLVVLLGVAAQAMADTVLFPVIAANPPAVTTIVSVTNQGPGSDHLQFTYSWKPTFSGDLPNYTGGCTNDSFTMPTFVPDLVSFDASGVFNGGLALFNDGDTYGGAFNTIGTTPLRAYLLVTNSNAAGTRLNVGSNISLRGEAIIMDVVSGSAWGYRAINDTTREDFSFFATPAGSVVNVIVPGAGESKRFTFFDLNSWTTRFFVTPIGTDLFSNDRTSTIQLFQSNGTAGIEGRTGDVYSFTKTQLVRCTAGVDLIDLLDSTSQAALATTGGWGRIDVVGGDPALIYKLEFTFSAPFVPGGASNNNAFLLSNAD